jgi:N-acetylglucosamine-6-phosphate deacetylase
MRGITALVPTTAACPADDLRRVLENVQQAHAEGEPGARLLGVHLESNFINPQYKGSQPLENIFTPADPQAEAVKALLDEYQDVVAIVTLAPELPGALELIPWLRARNIVVSLGHSAATYEQAIAAIHAGATRATHLFNAMSPLHHRNPGLVGAALERDEVFTEVVSDGVHLHPALISLIISAKGAERVVPVSDALAGAGTTAGEFTFGGKRVTVRDGVARLDDGTIAGSIVTMDQIVRLYVEQIGWDLGETLSMVSATPAMNLGFERLGRIAQGMFADLVVLDQHLDVAMTMVSGKVVYQR